MTGASETAEAAVVRRLFDEVMNAGRLELIDELMAEDAVEHEALPISTGELRRDFRAWVSELRKAFPDYHVQVEDVIAEGDRVATRERITGTNLGPLLGMPPTGRRMDIAGFDVVRVVDGRIVEHWGLADSWTMGRQLGIGTAGA